MRELLIDRLAELHNRNDGFSKSLLKFQNIRFNTTHVSDMQFGSYEYMSQFSDEELLALFELIVRVVNKQS
jgi:hypothetical protein